jgi:hypothetical protein
MWRGLACRKGAQMSGGSYDRGYRKVEDLYTDAMFDDDLNEMIADLVPLLKDLEWWRSADICEGGYRQTVKKFKDKWFATPNDKQFKERLSKKLKLLAEEMLQ